jgi:GWxTD domain-containing protein
MPARKMTILAALFWAIIVSGETGIGQEVFSENSRIGAPGFQVDCTQFKADSAGLNRLEIYYRIFNNNLQFLKVGNEFRATYEINIAVYDENGKQITAHSREKSLSLASYEKTTSDKDYRTSQFNLLLPQGKYKIACSLIDRNTGNSLSNDLRVNLHKYGGRIPELSGIEFAQTVDTVMYDSIFVKGDKTIIPSVDRRYGGDSAGVLLYYQEIYQGDDRKENVKIETQILDRKLDAVYRDTLTSISTPDGIIRQIRRVSLTGIKAGNYTLEVILKGRRDRIISSIKEPFSIYWSPIAMVRNDFDKAITQLKYIATSQEMKEFKKAQTPEEKIELWNKFWYSRDPSPGTPENELRSDYYRRIEYANRYFTVLKREGWLTDRGMVFITYGEPDQVEDFPFELNKKAYQIWYFYHSDKVRKFIFVDEWGDGDYILQYPYDGISQ